MGKYLVTEEWTNCRIYEVEASSQDEAVDLAQSTEHRGEVVEISDTIDNYYVEAVAQ